MNASIDTRPALAWEQRPHSELIRLAWPLVVSLVSVSLMTLVDTLFIGRIGPVEIAGAGLGGVGIFTVLSFGLAVFGAAKVRVSEDFGRGDDEQVRRTLGAFLRLAVVLGGASLVVGVLCSPLLPLLAADEKTGRLAGQYAAVRALGFPFVLVGAAIGQWLQAQGDAKSTMHAVLVANLANIPLNALFIFVLDGGVRGAAWATVCAGIVEMAWLAYLQSKRGVLLPGGRSTSPGFHLLGSTWREARDALRIGVPTGVERVLDMVTFTSVPIMLTHMGSSHVAAHQITLQIMLLSFLPVLALSEAVSVLIAQALGAERQTVVRSLVRSGMVMSLVYASLVGAVVVLGSHFIVRLFTEDTSVLAVGASTLVVGAVLQLLNAVYIQLKGALRGFSVFTYVAWVTTGCAWVITPPLTYWFAVRGRHGAPGAWWVLCLEVTAGVALLWVRLGPLIARRAVRDDGVLTGNPG